MCECSLLRPRAEGTLSVLAPIVGTVTTSTGARQATAAGLRKETAADRQDTAAETRDPAAPGTPFFFVQAALDGLDRPLAQTEFVVVDLETTGGSPANAAITELAAVRTRPGSGQPQPAEQEFATLVNPGRAIPPHVAMLTGITDALVTTAPRIEDVLPSFIEFAAGAVLVAHNAPFDIGFLAAACSAHNVPWPRLPTLDTAALARQLLTTDEVHDCRLGTLAGFFGAATRPNHRALDDARATTAVLHGLMGRLAERGVHTLEALRGFAHPPASQRRMRQLTAGVPRQPGVCLFTAADGQVLHVMRSSDMHARACGYFAAAETRRRVREMVDKTARIVPLSCQTGLEAEIAEIRLTAMHRPPYSTGRRVPAPPAQAAQAAQTDDDGRDGETGHRAARAVAISALAAARLLVAARPRFRGGWDVAWISYGRLEGTAVLRPASDPSPRTAESCLAAPCRVAASQDAWDAETACLADWLASPGVRLIETEGTWCCPTGDPRLQMHSAGQSEQG